MVRTQIRLTEAQLRGLKALAASRGMSIAELVRQGVDHVLHDTEAQNGMIERRRRASAIVGRFRSGVSDLSTNHDRYLADAYGS